MRPERGDILDNFTPDMAQFVADLLKTMPGARLVVRRSRRRPTTCAPNPNEARIGGVSYEMLAAMTAANAQRNGWPIADPPLDPFQWQSPAQRGRKNGRKRKREGFSRLSMMMTPMGLVSIIADRFCRDDEFHVIGPCGAHVVNIQLPATHAAVAEALDASGETRATSVIVSPRSWATLNDNTAQFRTYDSSFAR